LSNTFSKREDSAKITIQATGATSWRRNDVKYRKNEAFVDVVETVNLIVSAKGEKSHVYTDLSEKKGIHKLTTSCVFLHQVPCCAQTSMARS
jgi:hypothetical protein